MTDPIKLQRKRNSHEPDMTCEHYLSLALAVHATYGEAAHFLGVSLPTLTRWRRLYGMEVGR